MAKSKKIDGLQRIFDFIAFLNKEKIIFSIHNRAPDSITIDFAGIGIRYEVDFYVDQMNFSYTTGHEDVFTGDAELKKIIKEHWADD
jgi:hypothetical protein